MILKIGVHVVLPLYHMAAMELTKNIYSHVELGHIENRDM
jgi:hypothetical protein